MHARRWLLLLTSAVALGLGAAGVAQTPRPGRSAQAAPTARPPIASPATEIYLAPMRLTPTAPTMGPARVASDNPKGYDNQPFFGSDSRSMLFTSNRDGTQTDIYFLELPTRQIRRLTETPESEYSPTVIPGDLGVSVIRVEADGTQRVWQVGGDTPASPLLRDVKPVGYQAWIDSSRLAIYVLGTPASLQIADVDTGKSREVARDIGRSVARRPSGTISFVQREGAGWMVKEYEPDGGAIRPLVAALTGSADRDTAWAPDGTLFMTKGGDIYWWRPGQEGWTLMSSPEIGPLSRMAVSPDGRWMALVAAEPQR